ncbi:MAG: hypothetical protein ACXVO9_02240, partial [Bacteroidia bacterium]
MLKQIKITAFFFIFAATIANAQPTMDTIKSCLRHKPKPSASLDTRNSFINNDIVNVFGLIAGISYGKRLSFGIGYNQLYNPPKNFNQDVEYFNSFGKPYFVSSGIHFFYISAAVEYAFYETKHWEISMPLQIGVGQTYFEQNINGKRSKTDRHTNFIYEPAISVDYKFVKWIGIGADFGYRFFITDNNKLNREFNSPIVTLGVAVYYSE